MKQINIFFFLIISTLFFTSCEDVIDVDLEEGESQLTVDAWLTDQPENQIITLTFTQPYFNNNEPSPALNAVVNVVDNEGNTYNFTDADNNGTYIWTPSTPTETLCKLDNSYTLTVVFDGETYQANSTVNRVPQIDSIFYEFRDDELGGGDGYYAALYARDLEGIGDCYWIRTFKNGQYLNKPNEINVAFDAGFSEGGNIDGLIFITPIREGINPEPNPDADEPEAPYAVGDEIRVELYSISQEAFFFFQEVITQLNNGGLFAAPSANVSTNIRNVNPNSSKKPVGFFGTAAVSTATVIVEERR